jgi:hypothetical protein
MPSWFISAERRQAGAMASLLYKIFVLIVLIGGGYLLLRYGMDLDEQISRIVAFGVMPALTAILWYFSYRGKKYK